MARSLPPHPSLESLQKQAKQLLRAFRANEPTARDRVQTQHPRPDTFSGLRDAQLTLAREYGFGSWDELCDAVEAERSDTLSARGLADEFADLACLTYTELESPRRVRRAARLLERHPELMGQHIFAAAAAGHTRVIGRLLDEHPDRATECGGPRDWSPLLYLTYSRVPDAHPERSALGAAKLLLERGADPNDHFLLNDTYRFSALTGAMGEGEQGLESEPPHDHARALALLLLDAGADPNEAQGLYNSMFTPADEWLELLIERGLSRSDRINWDDGYRMSTLDYQLCAAVTRGFDERVRLLLRHGADPNAIDPYEGRSAYRTAVREGQRAIGDRLLEAGARADVLEPEDRMRMSCHAGDLGSVRRLGGAYPELLANPRLLADVSRRGNLDAIRALLDLGADVNATVPGGATPLHMAAQCGETDVATLLLERGAEIGARDDVYDASPISWANQFGQLALRDFLLDRTHDVFDLASWARVDQLETVLEAQPELVSARRARGLTPMHRLDVPGTPGAATIELLLRCGADINARTEDGRTPLDTRVSVELDDVAELLRQRGARRG